MYCGSTNRSLSATSIEHAFYVDYLNAKADYVNKFVQFLDGDESNRRWQALTR